MGTSRIIVLYLSIAFAFITPAIARSYPTLPGLEIAGWTLAAGFFALWFVRELPGFRRLVRRRGARYGASSGLSILLFIGIAILLGVLSTKGRFDIAKDFTKSKSNSLSKESQEVLSKVSKTGQKISLVGFFASVEARTEFENLMKTYLRYSDVFEIEYLDPQRDLARAQSLAESLTAENTVIVAYGSRDVRITTFSEEKLTNAILNVLKEGKKKIQFTSGHGEPALDGADERGLKQVKQLLENNKMEVSTLALNEIVDVEGSVDVLVIAGPRYDFKDDETRRLEKYLKEGGSLLVLLGATIQAPKLRSFLTKYGIAFEDDIVLLSPSDPRRQFFPNPNFVYVNDFDEYNEMTRDFALGSSVAMQFWEARSVSILEKNEKEFTPQIIAKSEPASIRVTGVNSAKDLEGSGVDQSRIKTGSQGMIAYSNKKLETVKDGSSKGDSAEEAMLVALGSGEFMGNISVSNKESQDLTLNIVGYLSGDSELVSLALKPPSASIDISSQGSQLLLLCISFLYPFVFLGGGTLIWMKRRKL